MVTENWWPADKSEEIGKVYLEIMKKYPDDKSIEKPILRSAIWTEKDAMHSITVSSIKPGKVKDSMDLASKRLLMLANKVKGYHYQIHPTLLLQEHNLKTKHSPIHLHVIHHALLLYQASEEVLLQTLND